MARNIDYFGKMWLSLCVLLFASSEAQKLQLTVDSSNFFDKFHFDTDDATNGYCHYQTETNAKNKGMAKIENNQIYLGVDMETTLDFWSTGRDSVKVVGNDQYTYGLFIIQLSHMPFGCGTWPAYWLDGSPWPYHGEIDVIEGVNVNDYDASTLHTSTGCSMGSSDRGTEWRSYDGGDCVRQPGCGIHNSDSKSYGQGLNDAGGAAYATLWNEDAIQHWFWTKDEIPADIKSKTPDVSTWGEPYAKFPFSSSCPSTHFKDMFFIINIELCSSAWGGGSKFSSEGCGGKGSCKSYITNPDNMKEAYWLIDSLDVYDTSGSGGGSTPNSGGSSTTSTPSGGSGGKDCCYVAGESACMPASSQWWCNESVDHCLGACNDSGDKRWGVPSSGGSSIWNIFLVDEEEPITADDWAIYGFAGIGLGFLLYGATRHFFSKETGYTVMDGMDVA